MQGAAASRNLMLCFEEIAVQNIILKAGKDSSVFPISIEAEFSEQKFCLPDQHRGRILGTERHTHNELRVGRQRI